MEPHTHTHTHTHACRCAQALYVKSETAQHNQPPLLAGTGLSYKSSLYTNPTLSAKAPLHLPSYLLKHRLGALRSGETPSNIQEVHFMPDPVAHLEEAPAVGDGLCEDVGVPAA